MKECNRIFKSKIDDYFNGRISKEELGVWAKKQYYKIISGDYLHIELMVLYKYLKIASTFHIIPDDIKDEYPCTEEEVSEIRQILEGNKNDIYSGFMRIHERFYERYLFEEKKQYFVQLRELVVHHLTEKKQFGHGQQEIVDKIINFETMEVQSIIDLLQLDIINILKNNRLFDDSSLRYNSDFALYVGRDELKYENMYVELLKLLDCVLGEKHFKICITFQSGISSMTIII